MTQLAEQQIALFAQRRFRGKLHLPGPSALPLCSRQLNNHREARSQQADRPAYAGSMEEFTYQLLSNRACKHCAYASGLLVKSVETSPSEDEEDTE